MRGERLIPLDAAVPRGWRVLGEWPTDHGPRLHIIFWRRQKRIEHQVDREVLPRAMNAFKFFGRGLDDVDRLLNLLTALDDNVVSLTDDEVAEELAGMAPRCQRSSRQRSRTIGMRTMSDLITGHRPIDALTDAPVFDARACPIWKNPSGQEFVAALQSDATDTSGLRGLVTQTDLYLWQSTKLSHPDFEHATSLDGIRIGLRNGKIMIDHEVVAVPECFPWVFSGDADQMDIEDRRVIVTDHLRAKLAGVYPNGFDAIWYF